MRTAPTHGEMWLPEQDYWTIKKEEIMKHCRELPSAFNHWFWCRYHRIASMWLSNSIHSFLKRLQLYTIKYFKFNEDIWLWRPVFTVYISSRMLLTMTVSFTSGEGSFSKVKLIKSHLTFNVLRRTEFSTYSLVQNIITQNFNFY